MSRKMAFGTFKRDKVNATWGIGDFPLMIMYFFCVYYLYLKLVFSVDSILIVFCAATLTSFFLMMTEPVFKAMARWTVRKFFVRFIKTEAGVSPIAGIFRLSSAKPEGYIYMVKRFKDGVYKIGKTTNFKRRFSSLGLQYGPVFMVALWEVPSCEKAENVALKMTDRFLHRHPRHRELRAMSDEDARLFIEHFTDYILSIDVADRVE